MDISPQGYAPWVQPPDALHRPSISCTSKTVTGESQAQGVLMYMTFSAGAGFSGLDRKNKNSSRSSSNSRGSSSSTGSNRILNWFHRTSGLGFRISDAWLFSSVQVQVAPVSSLLIVFCSIMARLVVTTLMLASLSLVCKYPDSFAICCGLSEV